MNYLTGPSIKNMGFWVVPHPMGFNLIHSIKLKNKVFISKSVYFYRAYSSLTSNTEEDKGSDLLI
jgi:hypothetical protein